MVEKNKPSPGDFLELDSSQQSPTTLSVLNALRAKIKGQDRALEYVANDGWHRPASGQSRGDENRGRKNPRLYGFSLSQRPFRPGRARRDQIGRASCRER